MVWDRLVKILTNLPRQKGLKKSGLVFWSSFRYGCRGDLDETLVNIEDVYVLFILHGCEMIFKVK